MGQKKKLREYWRNFFKNLYTYNVYDDKLKEIVVTLFRWINLPPEIDQRFLELSLYETGQVCFTKDEILDEYVVMRSTNNGKWDIYNNPRRRRLYASNSMQLQRTENDSVLIYNNILRTPSVDIVSYYADKFYFYDRIIDVNVNAQKTPVLIRCNENEKLSLLNLYEKYDGNEPFVFADKNLSPNPLEVLKTDAPFVADKIYDMKVKYWNEFLTFYGVSNVNINKKERLTTDEVNRQLGGAIAARGSALLMRKEACKKINDMFNLDIDVVFNEDYTLIVKDVNNELLNENETEIVDEVSEDV